VNKFDAQLIQFAYMFITSNIEHYERKRRIAANKQKELNKAKQSLIYHKRLEEAKEHTNTNNSLYERRDKKKKSGRVHNKFVPQALFQVALDDSSKQFMQKIVDDLIQGAGGLADRVSKNPVVKVKFDFLSNFWESCKSLYEWIKSLFGPIKKFILFVFELIAGIVRGPLKHALDFILQSLGITSPTETTEYIDEMKEGTALEDLHYSRVSEEKGILSAIQGKYGCIGFCFYSLYSLSFQFHLSERFSKVYSRICGGY